MTWSIYKIVHRLDDGSDKVYIGLTKRSLAKRFSAHLNNLSRGRPLARGSLGEALRLAHANDPQFASFSIALLEDRLTKEQVGPAEARQIEAFNSRAPAGYNLMPGGASLGGPANSRPVTITVDGSTTEYSSMSDLCDAFAPAGEAERERFYFKVIARHSLGWTLEEAVGLVKRPDGRWTERSVRARAAGTPLATVRSSDHRAIKRAASASAAQVVVPDPNDLSGPRTTPAGFARITGLSKSTVAYRARQIQHRLDQMTPSDIVAYLRTSQDRSKKLTVTLPSGDVITDTRNRLAARFERAGLGVDAIRARLAKLTENAGNDEVLVALGLDDSPERNRRRSTLPPIKRRKLLCDDWVIHHDGGTLQFANQKMFVDACFEAFCERSLRHRNVNPTAGEGLAKQRERLQKWMSKRTGDGLSPTELATEIGVIDWLMTRIVPAVKK